jgi:DNA-binding protein HU-beta
MNKAELIEVISDKLGLAKREVEDVIDTMTDTITSKLQQGDEVTLTGFGAFSARTRKGRIGVNPRKVEEKIEIPPVTVPKFKAGKNLKEALKGKSKAAVAPVTSESVAE